jgi:hypothetical protein
MEEKLDEEMVASICMYMRMVDFFRTYEKEISDKPEIVESVNELNARVKEMMDLLTDEQQDYVLEEYKYQKEYIENEKKEGL